MTRAALAGLLAVVACSCRGGHAPEERPPADPGSAPSERPAAAVSVSGGAIDVPLYQGMPAVDVVLSDPRLAEVREHEQAHDARGAARLLEAVRAATTLDGARACAWDYVAGRLHLAAGEASDAAAAFERVASSEVDGGARCPLVGRDIAYRDPFASGRDGRG